MTASKRNKHNRVFASMAQCSGATGVDMEMLRLAKENNCPGFDSGSRVDFRLVGPWLEENAKAICSDDTLQSWKKMLAKYGALKAKLLYEKERGRLIDVDEAGAWYEATSVGLSTKLDILETELPEKLLGLSTPEIRELMKQTAARIMNEWRKFEPAPMAKA